MENYAKDAVRRFTGRTIAETDIVLHAGQTEDLYPNHLDAEWRKTQDFGRRPATSPS